MRNSRCFFFLIASKECSGPSAEDETRFMLAATVVQGEVHMHNNANSAYDSYFAAGFQEKTRTHTANLFMAAHYLTISGGHQNDVRSVPIAAAEQ